MKYVLNLGQLVLAGAGAGAYLAADLARRGDDDRNKEHQSPTEISAQSNNEDQSDDESEELLQKFADDRADRNLHAIHVIDERGEKRARGVFVKEAGGAPQRGLIEVVAQIGDCAEAGVI